MKRKNLVESFIDLAIQNGGWMEMDRLYLRNRLLSLVGPSQVSEEFTQITPKKLIAALIELSIVNRKINPGTKESLVMESQLGDLLTPPPSVVNALFAEMYEKEPTDATDYFYRLNQQTTYLKEKIYDHPDNFSFNTAYGKMQAQFRKTIPSHDGQTDTYPPCNLCWENEGYLGEGERPAQSNRRFIRMNLLGESWGFQYSPVAYYLEEAFISAEKHQATPINQMTFQRLFTLLNIFPFYFIALEGKNHGHDVYRAGRDTFALSQAKIAEQFPLLLFKNIKAGIVDWPLTVIRLESSDQQSLSQGAYYLAEQWKNQGLKTNQDFYLSAVARLVGKTFQLDLILQKSAEMKEELDLLALMGQLTLGETVLTQHQKEQVSAEFINDLTETSAFSLTEKGQGALKDFIATL